MLVFLNGHNNLDSYGTLNVNQIKAATNPNVDVVVQWASSSYGKTRRVLIRDGVMTTVEELPAVDMGDYRNLIDFAAWAAKKFPANHYFVDVWNHGNGWKLSGTKLIKDISYDDISGHSITIPQLGLAMKGIKEAIGKNVDIYGSDACLMAMLEVNHEIAPYVDYAVGSEELEPMEGWNYTTLLNKWGATPAEVAKSLVSTYLDNYRNTGQNVTMSAFDLSHDSDAIEAAKALKSDIEANLPAAKTAADSALKFAYNDYVDIGDFVKKFGKEFSAEGYVIAAGGMGSDAEAHGLSIWLPTSSNDLTKYQEMQFDKDTGWSDMLRKLFGGN